MYLMAAVCSLIAVCLVLFGVRGLPES
jgi:hypothetical protein